MSAERTERDAIVTSESSRPANARLTTERDPTAAPKP
jgi:hypothetical protein